MPREQPHEAWLRTFFGLAPGSCVEGGSAFEDGIPLPALRLTPAHLHVAMDHLVLAGPIVPPLDDEDARGLAALAAPCFTEHGLTLHAPAADRWYLTGSALPDVLVRSRHVAAGRNIDAYLPEGPGARAWRRMLNEVQMTWHASDLSAERARRGLPAVNTLWLEGACGAATAARPPHVVSDDPALRGLARSAAPASPEPVAWPMADLDAVLREPVAATDLLVVPPGLHGAGTGAHEPTADGWTGFVAIAQRLAPRGLPAAYARLRCVLTGERHGVELELDRSDRWCFWRQTDPDRLFAGARP